MLKIVKYSLVIVFLAVAVVAFGSALIINNNVVNSPSGASRSTINSTLSNPVPVSPTPLCGRNDVTPLILRNLPHSNYIIKEIVKLQDISGKLLVLITRRNGNDDMWIYNVGNDGIFSNDDSARFVSQIRLPSYGYVGKVTGGLTTGTEKLYWIDEQPLGQNIMVCDLPSCTSISVVGTLTNYSALDIIPSTANNGIYIKVESINVGEQSVISCSFNQSGYDWCGLSDDSYVQRLSTNYRHLVGSSIRGQGIGYEMIDYPYTKYFYNINSDANLLLNVNSLPSSISPSVMINQGLMLVHRVNVDDVVSFDTTTGNTIRVEDTVPVSYSSPNYILSYQTIVSKVWVPIGLRYDFVKKNFGSNPLTIFSQTGIGQQAQITKSLFMLPNGQVISADKYYNSSNLYVYSYDCTP